MEDLGAERWNRDPSCHMLYRPKPQSFIERRGRISCPRHAFSVIDRNVIIPRQACKNVVPPTPPSPHKRQMKSESTRPISFSLAKNPSHPFPLSLPRTTIKNRKRKQKKTVNNLSLFEKPPPNSILSHTHKQHHLFFFVMAKVFSS